MDKLLIDCNYMVINYHIVEYKVNKIKQLQNQTIDLINNNMHELAKQLLTEISKIEKELKELGVELV